MSCLSILPASLSGPDAAGSIGFVEQLTLQQMPEVVLRGIPKANQLRDSGSKTVEVLATAFGVEKCRTIILAAKVT
jgi:hypothetical protein